ncbi:MAG: TRAFs-binding domain-containing protein [bacterium]|nr:TRAFs-binding domain-containing protein [bacterium]
MTAEKAKDDVRPVCFMVMPFGKKPVTRAYDGAPAELDNDRLWDLAYRPAIEACGYQPVRADLESTGAIVKDMLNRLKHAPLVVADVSLPNGNVYYELGIRHVAQERNCVQVAANWFSPLFDIQQFRTVTFPLTDGNVTETEATAIRAILEQKINDYRVHKTPYFETVSDKPEEAFEAEARRISQFQAEISEARLLASAEAQKTKAAAIRDTYQEAAEKVPEIAIELLALLRDMIGWQEALAFANRLPQAIRDNPTIEEQAMLAESKLGNPEKAIAVLKELIKKGMPTPERYGLIAGRYKKRYLAAVAARKAKNDDLPGLEESGDLNDAIENYELGMNLDLNEYFCACNLPSLLRTRDQDGDAAKADIVDHLVTAACRRAVDRGSKDPWLQPTLFGAAFRMGDVRNAQKHLIKMAKLPKWMLESTWNDTETWVSQAPTDKQAVLEKLRGQLEQAFRKPKAAENEAGA